MALSHIFKLDGLTSDETAFEPLKKLLGKRGLAQMVLKPPAHHVREIEAEPRGRDKPDATELPEMIHPLLKEGQQRGILGCEEARPAPAPESRAGSARYRSDSGDKYRERPSS